MDHSFDRLQEDRSAVIQDAIDSAPQGGIVNIAISGAVHVLNSDGSIVGLPDDVRVFPTADGFVGSNADGWVNESFATVEDAISGLRTLRTPDEPG